VVERARFDVDAVGVAEVARLAARASSGIAGTMRKDGRSYGAR
jgi:hypothetical protein